MSEKAAVGSVGWIDLTVDDAEGIRDFYADVVGFVPQPVDMGEYADFNMTSPGSGEPRAGVCHRRGSNAQVPRGWMVYFIVTDLEAALAAAKAGGGKVLVEPRGGEGARFAMIEDPSGATCALYQAG